MPPDELLDEELLDEELLDDELEEEELLEELPEFEDELDELEDELELLDEELLPPSVPQLNMVALESLPSPCMPKFTEAPAAILLFQLSPTPV